MRSGTQGSELITSPDGRLYHLDQNYLPPNVLLMGAAGRVREVAKHFNSLLYLDQNPDRPEFTVAVGMFRGVKIAAVSCGIGMGPIDIFAGEAHALWEHDVSSDRWSTSCPRVNIIRVGTCATPQRDIPVGTLAISEFAIGLDTAGIFYFAHPERRNLKAVEIEDTFRRTAIGRIIPLAYAASASPQVVSRLRSSAQYVDNKESRIECGITLAAPGFFGPQGREIGRLRPRMLGENFLGTVSSFRFGGMGIVNIEMETSLLFLLCHEILGYNVGAICMVAANRMTGEMISKEYADRRMAICIRVALETMVELNRPEN